MGDSILHRASEFGHALFVPVGLEDRVVAESAGSTNSSQDPPRTFPARDGAFAGGPHQGRDAHEAGAPIAGGDLVEGFEKAGNAPRIVETRAAEAGRERPRGPVQRAHLQARIVRQGPLPQLLGNRPGLLDRVDRVIGALLGEIDPGLTLQGGDLEGKVAE